MPIDEREDQNTHSPKIPRSLFAVEADYLVWIAKNSTWELAIKNDPAETSSFQDCLPSQK